MAYDKRMDNLPLFISFPRCGSHWINAASELYFNRPRLREGRTTFLDRKRKDWMWFHDHDLGLDIEHDNVLYLYRNPIEVMYSDSMSERGGIDMQFIERRANLYKNHLKKYLLNDNVSVVRYENFRKDFNSEFEKVVEFFGGKWKPGHLNHVKSVVTKEALIERSTDKQFIGKNLVSEQYQESREDFKNSKGDWVNAVVIDSELQPFFEGA